VVPELRHFGRVAVHDVATFRARIYVDEQECRRRDARPEPSIAPQLMSAMVSELGIDFGRITDHPAPYRFASI